MKKDKLIKKLRRALRDAIYAGTERCQVCFREEPKKGCICAKAVKLLESL